MGTDHTEPSTSPAVARRLHRAFGPIAGGMILDGVDFLTFGPIGIWAGAVVGGAVGLWVSGIYRFSNGARLFWAAMAAIYCTVPATELFPIATVLGAAARFFDDRDPRPQADAGERS